MGISVQPTSEPYSSPEYLKPTFNDNAAEYNSYQTTFSIHQSPSSTQSATIAIDPSPAPTSTPSSRSSQISPNSPTNPSPTSSSHTEPPTKIQKRQLNTLAARRYRQKRVSLVQSLEAQLKAVQDERDALKVRVARLEGETDMLKELLRR